jgi:hypothetical protein
MIKAAIISIALATSTSHALFGSKTKVDDSHFTTLQNGEYAITLPAVNNFVLQYSPRLDLILALDASTASTAQPPAQEPAEKTPFFSKISSKVRTVFKKKEKTVMTPGIFQITRISGNYFTISSVVDGKPHCLEIPGIMTRSKALRFKTCESKEKDQLFAFESSREGTFHIFTLVKGSVKKPRCLTVDNTMQLKMVSKDTQTCSEFKLARV